MPTENTTQVGERNGDANIGWLRVAENGLLNEERWLKYHELVKVCYSMSKALCVVHWHVIFPRHV